MIYADFNGSAPLNPEVKKFLSERINDSEWANPNAVHTLGKNIKLKIEESRSVCAEVLGAKREEIIFNSGSSEGISHILHHCLSSKNKDKNIIITSGIEHSAVRNGLKYYAETLGYEIKTIHTKEEGVIDLTHLKTLLDQAAGKIALVCVMAANNETGVIQPYQEIGKICHEHHAIYFSDTTQLIGKTNFNFSKSNIDFAVMSGHKVGALIGSGILLSKDGQNLKPLIFGGGQENGKRGGTQNYIGIETLSVALKAFQKNISHIDEIKKARENFEDNIKKKFPNIVILGKSGERLASTTLISYPKISGNLIQEELQKNNLYVTTSSACSDGKKGSSAVLKAMGIPDEVGGSVVRISLCLHSNCEIYSEIEHILEKSYEKLKNRRTF